MMPRAGSQHSQPTLYRLVLTVQSGPDKGKTCVVDRDVVTVGKLADSDLVLTDPTVSRSHLRIARMAGDEWRLYDLGSTNGTYISGGRVTEATISSGAVFRAGRVEISFAPERREVDIPLWPEEHFGPLIGRSEVMRRLFGLAHRVAPTEATVLLQGETGTGKGLLAQAIHRASSRARNDFVVVDCSAVQRQLAESELFGHEKGAFSGAYARREGAFESANGGTVFVDELGELELDLQPKLLRVLDAREVRPVGATKAHPVDLRVVAASRRDLHREVERGVFREDLYFRLSVVTMTIPPLRDRPEDIPLLVEHFVEEAARSQGIRPPRLDDESMERVVRHDWPGNVRELKNTIDRAVLLSAVRPGARLAIDGLPVLTPGPPRLPTFNTGLTFGETKERWMTEREVAYIKELLQRHDGNVSAAARSARMDRKYLHKLMRRHSIS
ncbi:MAG: sigma 54-interacting transcriptional regulator [Myxococcales bacterium]|nr:sigma 54-interacting transcriptional regulator [Myxococcales bacterium]